MYTAFYNNNNNDDNDDDDENKKTDHNTQEICYSLTKRKSRICSTYRPCLCLGHDNVGNGGEYSKRRSPNANIDLKHEIIKIV